MLGLFGIFGRAAEIQYLDEGLRAGGLHPRLVPDAVKIATVRMLKEELGRQPRQADCYRAAELLCFCIMGGDDFAGATDDALAEAVDARIARAVEDGDSLDARLVMLTLQAGLTQGGVVERHGLEMEG